MADYKLILEGSKKKIKLLQTLVEEMGLEYQIKKKDKIQKKKKLNRKQQEFVDGLKEALHEVELAEQGKIKLKSWEDLKKEMAFPK